MGGISINESDSYRKSTKDWKADTQLTSESYDGKPQGVAASRRYDRTSPLMGPDAEREINDALLNATHKWEPCVVGYYVQGHFTPLLSSAIYLLCESTRKTYAHLSWRENA